MDAINKIWPQWETVELLGSGSYGKVYKVRRREMGKEYFSAVKVVRIPSDDTEIKDLQRSGMDVGGIHSYFEGTVKNLLNEIQIMESLKSANNIVSIEDHQILELGEGEIGWEIYIRMELLQDIGTYLLDHKMTSHEVIKLGCDLCGALASCEKVNIIHRDIKIDNVFVTEFGNYKLGDFGIAKQLEKTQSAMSQKGTNMYMAPEVFRGENYNQTVDIYSLGILLYRLLNDGRFPFMPPIDQPIQYNDQQFSIEQRLSGKPLPDPVNADEELSRIIRKASEYRSEDRYQSAEELLHDLNEYRLLHKSKTLANVVSGEQDNKNHVSDGKTTSAFGMMYEHNNPEPIQDFTEEKNKDAVEEEKTENKSLTEDKEKQQEPEKEKKGKKEKEENKKNKGIPIITLASVILIVAVVAVILFRNKIFKNAESQKSVLSQTVTTVSKLGISLQFPEGWKADTYEDGAIAKKDGKYMGVTVNYVRNGAYDDDDQTLGMGKELAEHLFKNAYNTTQVKESALYDINGRRFYHVRYEYEGSNQSRFITFEDKTEICFSMETDGNISDAEESLFKEVMKSVKLNFKGIDYSELKPADANEDPFAIGETITNADAFGISVKFPKVCKSQVSDDKITAKYSGSTYNDGYTLEFTKKDVSGKGFIDNGMNDVTRDALLKQEESELGHIIRNYEVESLNGVSYLYLRSTDDINKYISLITIVNGVQYEYRMIYEYWKDYSGARGSMENIVKTIIYK